MTEDHAAALRECATVAYQRANEAITLLDAKPVAWRGSPIFEREVGDVLAGLRRISSAAEEVLRL